MAQYQPPSDSAIKAARIRALKGKLAETGVKKGLEAVANKGLEQLGGSTGGGFTSNLINTLGSGSYAPGGGVAMNIASAAPYAMMAAPALMAITAALNRNRTKMAEEKKAQKLSDAGVKLPENILQFEKEFRGDLAEDFVGEDASGKFVNQKFAKSRNEKDLVAEDYLRRGALFEMFDGDQEAMKKLAEVAASKGLGREAKGQIQTILTPELEANAEALGLKLRGGRGDYRIAMGDPNAGGILGGLQEADRQGSNFQKNNPFSDLFTNEDSKTNRRRDAALNALVASGMDKSDVLKQANSGMSVRDMFSSAYDAKKQAALQSLGISPVTAGVSKPLLSSDFALDTSKIRYPNIEADPEEVKKLFPDLKKAM